MKKSLFAGLFTMMAVVGLVLASGCGVPEPNVTNRGSDDPLNLGPSLSRAILNGDVDEAADLLEHGAPLNYRNDPDGWTPLMYAIYYDNGDAIEMLIEAKADVNLADYSGMTPLMMAAMRREDADLIEDLIEAGADVRRLDNKKRTALDYAMLYKMSDNKEALIENTPKVVADPLNNTTVTPAKD